MAYIEVCDECQELICNCPCEEPEGEPQSAILGKWVKEEDFKADQSAKRQDAVTHPSHYQSDNGIECIDAIRAALGREGFIAHCRGTAIKYAWRSGKKAAHAEDLRKACVYLEWAAKAIEEGD